MATSMLLAIDMFIVQGYMDLYIRLHGPICVVTWAYVLCVILTKLTLSARFIFAAGSRFEYLSTSSVFSVS